MSAELDADLGNNLISPVKNLISLVNNLIIRSQ